jgi:hypothetical protein
MKTEMPTSKFLSVVLGVPLFAITCGVVCSSLGLPILKEPKPVAASVDTELSSPATFEPRTVKAKYIPFQHDLDYSLHPL